MAKILALGDPHFKVSNVLQIEEMVPLLYAYLEREKPDIIVVLGDTLHTHELVHVSALTRAIQFLHDLMESAEVFLLLGNHDLKNNQQFFAAEHPFTALKYWGDRMHVIDRTQTFIRQEQRLTFVPYVPPGRFHEALEHVPEWRESACIFAHQEFAGVQMNVITSHEGDPWPEEYPLVVSGHIHQYQELQPNLLYPGSLMQHGFGDCVQKSISLLTWNMHYTHQRIYLGLRNKKICHLSYADVSTFQPPPECELKIIITGTKAEIASAKQHPQVILWTKAGHKLCYKEIKQMTMPTTEQINERQNFGSYFYHSLPKKELQDEFVTIFGAPQ